MMQTAPVLALNRRMPLPPVSPSLGAVTPPPLYVGADWASRHPSGWPTPSMPELVQRRWPWLYGMPFGIPVDADPYLTLTRRRAPALPYPYRFGLGQQTQQPPGPTTAQSVGSAAAGAAAGTSQILAGNPVAGAGTMLLGAAPLTGPAAPFVAIAGAAAEILGAIGIGRGCGQTCIKASEYANKAGDLMAQNMNAYLALPAPRAASIQATALSIFDQLWAGLVQACSDPSLSDAGVRCITDRQQGACKWKASPGGWHQGADGSWSFTPWGPSGSGSSCWNWFIGMRDPISQDPMVVADAQSAQATQLQASTSGVAGTVTGSGSGALLLGALVLFALMNKGNSKGGSS